MNDNHGLRQNKPRNKKVGISWYLYLPEFFFDTKNNISYQMDIYILMLI